MPLSLRGRLAVFPLALVVILPFGLAPAASAGDRCEGADLRPGQGSYAELGRTTLCLVNRERTRRGLRPLHANARLALAARRHSRDMVRQRYFTHDSRSGPDFASRIARTGYFRGAASWRAGENMAWGAGTSATPRHIVRGWMDSPGHRANILRRGFRDLGVGVSAGAPVSVDYSSAATYVHDFGVRR